MASALSITTRAVEKNIQNLKKNKKLMRKGGKKFGYWQVIE